MITKTVTNYKNDTEFSLLYIDDVLRSKTEKKSFCRFNFRAEISSEELFVIVNKTIKETG